MAKPHFRFKHFILLQDRCAMKVSTDGVMFGAWVRYGPLQRILDIGTGTGLLAMIAAQRCPTAWIDAVEVDAEAAGQAAANIAAGPWADRMRVHAMDVRRLHAAEPYDLIVCNPPYYAGYSGPEDPRVAVAKHSQDLGFSQLLEVAARWLGREGRLAVILPLNREEEFLRNAEKVGLHPVRRCRVRYVPHRPPKRSLLELERKGGPVLEEELTVEASGPFDLSPAYKALVADLMLNF